MSVWQATPAAAAVGRCFAGAQASPVIALLCIGEELVGRLSAAASEGCTAGALGADADAVAVEAFAAVAVAVEAFGADAVEAFVVELPAAVTVALSVAGQTAVVAEFAVAFADARGTAAVPGGLLLGNVRDCFGPEASVALG